MPTPPAARPVDVRRITDDELLAWTRSVHRTFQSETPLTPEHVEARRPRYADQRLTGAFDGDTVVGTFRSWDVDLPLPGGTTAVTDAISSVTVATTHRRRGVLTRMMLEDLRAAVERGTPLAVLIASEGRIYGRYGFGPAVDHQRLVLTPSRAGLTPDGPGSLEHVEDADLRDVAPDVHERARRQQPGSMPRSRHWWDVALRVVDTPDVDRSKAVYATVYRDEDGAAQGYVRFRVEGAWSQRVPQNTLVVDDLTAATADAHRALWAHVASTDVITAVRADDRGVDDPLPHLTPDPRAAQPSERADFEWVRVLDTPTALAARRYALPGRAVLEVVDDLDGATGPAAGRWSLEVGEDGVASVEATTAPADVVLPVQVLGSVLLGQHQLLPHAVAGRVVGEPGAVLRTSALLAWPGTGLSTLTWF